MCRYLCKGELNKRIGCIIANRDKDPQDVAEIIADKYNLKGVINAPVGGNGGSMGALEQAFWLIKDGGLDAVIVGGLDFNVNR